MTLSSQRTRDHHALDVRGALIDLTHADIAIDLREAELFQVAVATQRLNCARAHRLSRFGRDELRHRGFGEARCTGVLDARRMQDELSRCFESRREIRQSKTDRLMLDDGL